MGASSETASSRDSRRDSAGYFGDAASVARGASRVEVERGAGGDGDAGGRGNGGGTGERDRKGGDRSARIVDVVQCVNSADYAAIASWDVSATHECIVLSCCGLAFGQRLET